MENRAIARRLLAYADLLELLGANPFRVRAYRNAADAIEETQTPVIDLLAAGEDLSAIPSLGRQMARHVEEIARTGVLAVVEELASGMPPSLLEVARLRGLGPQRAVRLWRELGVRDLADLERAARGGRLVQARGFGAASRARILEALEARPRQPRGLRLPAADRLAEVAAARLAGVPGVRSVHVAGSLRRRQEITTTLLLLLAGGEVGAALEALGRLPRAGEPVRTGPGAGRVVLSIGPAVALRIVDPAGAGAALVWHTGNGAHRRALARIAADRSLRFGEDGLRDPAGRLVAGATEEEVYDALGLPLIPPELREGAGSVRAARTGALPRLVSAGELRGDLQVHTTWSDGRHTLERMVAAALDRGHAYIAITDHGPAPAIAGGLGPDRLRLQAEEIAVVASRHPGLRILRGVEVDIHEDGTLDLDDGTLASLDIVLAAVHSRFNLPRAVQTRRLLRALANPRVGVLAHPTCRLLGRRNPIDVDLERVLREAARQGVAVEIDAQPERLDLDPLSARRARELGATLVISTDAHRDRELDFLRYGVDQARRAGLGPDAVLNTRPAAEVLAFLRARRGRGVMTARASS